MGSEVPSHVLQRLVVAGVVGTFVVGSAGCAVHLHKRLPSDLERIATLSEELERERRLREQERAKLDKTLEQLRRALRKEIDDRQVKVGMEDRGLVITFVAEVLFDSGKAEIRPEAYPVLDKVAKFLTDVTPDRRIAIEGHTDNEPIKHSGWKSNWELSTARATSVLHYLVDEKGITPDLVHATGYGEYRPVASNDATEGRQQNRRVEIVILPKELGQLKAEAGLLEPATEAEPAHDRDIK